jgi:hypothetical protein
MPDLVKPLQIYGRVDDSQVDPTSVSSVARLVVFVDTGMVDNEMVVLDFGPDKGDTRGFGLDDHGTAVVGAGAVLERDAVEGPAEGLLPVFAVCSTLIAAVGAISAAAADLAAADGLRAHDTGVCPERSEHPPAVEVVHMLRLLNGNVRYVDCERHGGRAM